MVPKKICRCFFIDAILYYTHSLNVHKGFTHLNVSNVKNRIKVEPNRVLIKQLKSVWLWSFLIICYFQTVNWAETICRLFCSPTSMWPAFSRGGGHFWPLTQLVGQCGPIHLQRSGSAPHPDQVEASSVRQQGLVLRQPVPRLLLPQQSHPRPGALLQVENGHRGLWRQHRYRYSCCPVFNFPVVRLCVHVCVVMNVSLFENLQHSYSLNCPEKQEVPGELQKAALLLRVQRVLCNLSS